MMSPGLTFTIDEAERNLLRTIEGLAHKILAPRGLGLVKSHADHSKWLGGCGHTKYIGGDANSLIHVLLSNFEVGHKDYPMRK